MHLITMFVYRSFPKEMPSNGHGWGYGYSSPAFYDRYASGFGVGFGSLNGTGTGDCCVFRWAEGLENFFK